MDIDLKELKANMFVKYIAENNDLLIVNAARVSFNKFKTVFDDKDRKLLKYLYEHDHWSPFAHGSMRLCCEILNTNNFINLISNNKAGIDFTLLDNNILILTASFYWIKQNWKHFDRLSQKLVLNTFPEASAACNLTLNTALIDENTIFSMPSREYIFGEHLKHIRLTFHVKVPIFIARQLMKHQVDLVVNEISRRYVNDNTSYYYPDSWRKRAENKKQGSSDEIIYNEIQAKWYNQYIQLCDKTYHNLILTDIAPEQARLILPLSLYTEFYWTGNLAAFVRIYKQRSKDNAQKEINIFAELLRDAIPGSYYKSLFESEINGK